MVRQQRLQFIQKSVTGQQVKKAVTVAVRAIRLNALVLMFLSALGNLHGGRFLLVGCGFGDLQPSTLPALLFVNQVVGLKSVPFFSDPVFAIILVDLFNFNNNRFCI